MAERVWHDRRDYPITLGLIEAVIGNRQDHDRLGYWPEAEGADLDWDLLTGPAPVSSTQTAALMMARGCAILERHGGLPPHLRGAVVAAVDALA